VDLRKFFLFSIRENELLFFTRCHHFVLKGDESNVNGHGQGKMALLFAKICSDWFRNFKDVDSQIQWLRFLVHNVDDFSDECISVS